MVDMSKEQGSPLPDLLFLCHLQLPDNLALHALLDLEVKGVGGGELSHLLHLFLCLCMIGSGCL